MTAEPALNQPRDHVQRPDLPWRDGRLTECGKSIDDVRSFISRDEFLKRIKVYGNQRTAFITCMTCINNVDRWKEWNVDPIDTMSREFYSGRQPHPRLADELRALAALVDAHREEFDGYITGLGETVDLTAARNAKRRTGPRPIR